MRPDFEREDEPSVVSPESPGGVMAEMTSTPARQRATL